MHPLINDIVGNRDRLLEELRDLTPAQWEFRPTPESWSIFEVTEHVALVEGGIARMLEGRLFAQTATMEQNAETAGKDSLVVDAMRDREQKRPAPEFVRPRRKWPTPPEAVAALVDARARTVAQLGKETRNLRDYCAPHPSFQTLDGHQWVLFLVAHAERHLSQIQEIKADQGYPSWG